MVARIYPHRSPNSTKLKKAFYKYASESIDGEACMSADDFIRRYIEVFPRSRISEELIRILATIADTNHDGVISYDEYDKFETLLWSSDALYKITFRIFDRSAQNEVSFQDFRDIVKMTELYNQYPFNFDCELIDWYFGSDRQKRSNYNEFSQLLRAFPEEYAKQIYKSKDKGSGFISNADFQDIMVGVKRRLITGQIAEQLTNITDDDKVSYGFFKAFTSLLENSETVKYIYLEASRGSKKKALTKDELLRVGQTKGMTPYQANILYKLVKLTSNQDTISYNDLCTITPQHTEPVTRSIFIQILESCYRFTLGSIAGGTGAFAVYPIDLVKTRMQNQRIKNGVRMYNNLFDCFVKVVRNEGILGLYRGVPIQVLGIAPEKAIKLTVNDFVRDKGTDANGHVPLKVEILGGCLAGLFQDLVTNPLEIVKIRLQTAGEVGQRLRAIPIIRELGIRGLYKGVKACLLRDIPFAGIYFPCYAHFKTALADENGYNRPISLLAAGVLAGIPAASLVTPADVIKTRLQVVARTGQTKYSGLTDAAIKIMKEEGPGAFWKGVVPRVLKSSPQLGVTLFTYELLQRLFYVDFGGRKPRSGKKKDFIDHSPYTINPDLIGGYKFVVPMLNSIESNFGLCLPRFGRPVS